MSDFFSGIYAGARGPDVVMNEGPLPPTSSAGMPPGFNGTPDAKIDYSSSLLGDMNPYAYGEPGRLSTQAAYLNIPHVAQRIVPQINLPEPQTTQNGGGFMSVTHQVDDGDVAFIVRAMFSPFDLVSDKKKYNRQGILYAIDPVVNLATTNYILHGLQRYGFDPKNAKNWNTLWVAFGIDTHFKSILGGKNLSAMMWEFAQKIIAVNPVEQKKARECMYYARRMLARYIIQNIITPFGIPRGSERQGGQHQGEGYRSVTNPVDFVTALVIDGKAINLVNLWLHDDISAGDDLCLYLDDGKYADYTLSHNPRSHRRVQFEPLNNKWEMPTGLLGTGQDCNPKLVGLRKKFVKACEGDATAQSKFPQIVAEIVEEVRKRRHDGSMSSTLTTNAEEPIFQLVPGVASSPSSGMCSARWNDGYWHIARSQVMQFKHDIQLSVPNGAGAALTRTKLLEVTFSPVWIEPLSNGSSACGIAPPPKAGKKAGGTPPGLPTFMPSTPHSFPTLPGGSLSKKRHNSLPTLSGGKGEASLSVEDARAAPNDLNAAKKIADTTPSDTAAIDAVQAVEDMRDIEAEEEARLKADDENSRAEAGMRANGEAEAAAKPAAEESNPFLVIKFDPPTDTTLNFKVPMVLAAYQWVQVFNKSMRSLEQAVEDIVIPDGALPKWQKQSFQTQLGTFLKFANDELYFTERMDTLLDIPKIQQIIADDLEVFNGVLKSTSAAGDANAFQQTLNDCEKLKQVLYDGIQNVKNVTQEKITQITEQGTTTDDVASDNSDDAAKMLNCANLYERFSPTSTLNMEEFIEKVDEVIKMLLEVSKKYNISTLYKLSYEAIDFGNKDNDANVIVASQIKNKIFPKPNSANDLLMRNILYWACRGFDGVSTNIDFITGHINAKIYQKHVTLAMDSLPVYESVAVSVAWGRTLRIASVLGIDDENCKTMDWIQDASLSYLRIYNGFQKYNTEYALLEGEKLSGYIPALIVMACSDDNQVFGKCDTEHKSLITVALHACMRGKQDIVKSMTWGLNPTDLQVVNNCDKYMGDVFRTDPSGGDNSLIHACSMLLRVQIHRLQIGTMNHFKKLQESGIETIEAYRNKWILNAIQTLREYVNAKWADTEERKDFQTKLPYAIVASMVVTFFTRADLQYYHMDLLVQAMINGTDEKMKKALEGNGNAEADQTYNDHIETLLKAFKKTEHANVNSAWKHMCEITDTFHELCEASGFVAGQKFCFMDVQPEDFIQESTESAIPISFTPFTALAAEIGMTPHATNDAMEVEVENTKPPKKFKRVGGTKMQR